MSEKCIYPLIPLPYPYDALENHISEETLMYHHDKHLKTYVDNLNDALAKYPEYQCMSLDQLLININELPDEIRDKVRKNAGGVYNHNLYFHMMTPKSKERPEGPLHEKIVEQFQDYSNFKKLFSEAAMGVFGSGYAWLACEDDGNLKILTTPNQDTILPMKLHPLTLIDVWEHAYYIDYRNLRAKYVENWFDLVNWTEIEALYGNLTKR